MKKSFLITAILLLTSAWVVAQSSSTAPAAPDNSQSTGQQANAAQEKESQGAEEAQHSIEGCLTKVTGAYHLTEDSGKVHTLIGDTHLLADHNGQQIQVWGAEVINPHGTASSSGSPPTFTVTKVKMVSATCASK